MLPTISAPACSRSSRKRKVSTAPATIAPICRSAAHCSTATRHRGHRGIERAILARSLRLRRLRKSIDPGARGGRRSTAAYSATKMNNWFSQAAVSDERPLRNRHMERRSATRPSETGSVAHQIGEAGVRCLCLKLRNGWIPDLRDVPGWGGLRRQPFHEPIPWSLFWPPVPYDVDGRTPISSFARHRGPVRRQHWQRHIRIHRLARHTPRQAWRQSAHAWRRTER